MVYANPQTLVETDWLGEHLADPDLRILDCTVYMPNYFEDSAAEKVEIVSGRAHWEEGHIPGSAFADLTAELRGPDDARFMFPMPSAEQFEREMSKLGVGERTHVVLYDDMINIYATRLWWILRVHGFDNVSVLNGGWSRWTGEDRPVSTEPPAYPPGDFKARFRRELIATKDDVRSAINNGSTCVVNALDPDEYAGRGPVRYTRPGHIPGSSNISFLGIIDPETSRFRPEEELRALVEEAGALERERVISYCGGAIAATGATFVMNLLGKENLAVYEGSLTEWGADSELPMVTGDAAR